MRLLGYAGSSANRLGRGVEGCMPGTMGIEAGENETKDKEEVALLSTLILQWREQEATVKVLPRQVVPDFTNRAQTGLGVELLHFVAISMRDSGFQKRQGTQGHDIPVVVREPPHSATRKEALEVWTKRVAEEEGFPPVQAEDHEDLYTSLGNGHFFQSLNLFACGCASINEDNRRFEVKDPLLAEAISDGVPSIILQHTTPRPVRAKIAALLNSRRDFTWTLKDDGTVDTNGFENTGYCSQFEWLSKGMDAEQVNCLVRTHLGIKESKRIQG